ncbi:MAG: hypothetical protein U5L73_14825 [Rhodoferax sp.]|uniref:hypothetical protein n=1 Tax=Rhodoferax sp. TaxID=50421 RepID=UPI002ACDAFDD|nr:hypothetical protein [Rhodoferax sp.]MDZ7893015.1 hypothetical protein [Rhodoferax sp.]
MQTLSYSAAWSLNAQLSWLACCRTALARAGFRFLGIRSHAVHIHGFTPDGCLWCGRRSLTEACSTT